jgi:hypothetical protein
MPQSDAFALKNSGLNEFLFAEVGKEVNGSPLTILSVMARLGQDPWIEAARLARLPKATIIDCLASSFSQMPLCPQALIDARATATRITLLLPSQAPSRRNGEIMPVGKSSVPRWVPMAVFFAALAFGIAFEMIPSARPTNTVAPLAEPAMEHKQAPAR